MCERRTIWTCNICLISTYMRTQLVLSNLAAQWNLFRTGLCCIFSFSGEWAMGTLKLMACSEHHNVSTRNVSSKINSKASHIFPLNVCWLLKFWRRCNWYHRDYIHCFFNWHVCWQCESTQISWKLVPQIPTEQTESHRLMARLF
jgi:hypothetical protein